MICHSSISRLSATSSFISYLSPPRGHGFSASRSMQSSTNRSASSAITSCMVRGWEARACLTVSSLCALRYSCEQNSSRQWEWLVRAILTSEVKSLAVLRTSCCVPTMRSNIGSARSCMLSTPHGCVSSRVGSRMRTCRSRGELQESRSTRELSVRRGRMDPPNSEDSSSAILSRKGLILSARLEKKFLQLEPNCSIFSITTDLRYFSFFMHTQAGTSGAGGAGAVGVAGAGLLLRSNLKALVSSRSVTLRPSFSSSFCEQTQSSEQLTLTFPESKMPRRSPLLATLTSFADGCCSSFFETQ